MLALQILQKFVKVFGVLYLPLNRLLCFNNLKHFEVPFTVVVGVLCVFHGFIVNHQGRLFKQRARIHVHKARA